MKEILAQIAKQAAAHYVAKKANEKFSKKSQESVGVFSRLKNNPETQKKYEKISETTKKDREGFFASLWDIAPEAGQSWLHRNFPGFAKVLGAIEGVTESGDEEVYSLEHDIQVFGGISMFIPNFLLKYATNPVKKILKPILESGFYPGADNLVEMVNSDDPDGVVNAVLAINQDIVTGKVSFDKVFQNIFSGSLSKLTSKIF